MSISLRTASDVRKIRTSLLKLQKNNDQLTGANLLENNCVLDHDHNTMLVRGVIHRQVNAFLGKVENSYTRYIKYWSNVDLPTLLRMCANYLEKNNNVQLVYYHPAWIKKAKINFNKLTADQQKSFLRNFNIKSMQNPKERKNALVQVIKQINYDQFKDYMKEYSEKPKNVS